MTGVIECPKCGQPANSQKWYEDYWMVEERIDCPCCGYVYHWSYGSVVEFSAGETEGE